MSEQVTNKKSSKESGGSVVMVEKTATSRHKPYRPTDLQEEPAPDLHKRSKAPAVPSLTEELKNTTVSEAPSQRDRMECERTMASETHMHVAKNISSSGKRRGSSPESIAMVPRDSKKDTIATLPQPIPAKVETVVSEISRDEARGKAALDKTADDDSITEEITELRTSEAVKEHSEWSDDEEAGGLPRSESRGSRVSRAVRQLFCCGVAHHAPSEEPAYSSSATKKKEISWQDNKYLETVQLQDMKAKSQATILERKASVGPCRKPSMLYGGPSGITVCVPKKSVRSMKEEFNPIQSVIDINISKKLVAKSSSHVDRKISKKQEKESTIKIEPEQGQDKFFGILRLKLDTMSSKIRNLLNM